MGVRTNEAACTGLTRRLAHDEHAMIGSLFFDSRPSGLLGRARQAQERLVLGGLV